MPQENPLHARQVWRGRGFAMRSPVLEVTTFATPAEPLARSAVRHLTRNLTERCVMARVQRAGQRFYRCFALARHGTWEAAEAAARLWLRPVLAALPTSADAIDRLTTRNRSGIVGVCFRQRPRVLKTGRLAAYPVFVARWPGAAMGVAWSLRACGGEDGAFLRACLSRELRTADRTRVEWALRSLPPERRDALLARKRSLPTPPLEADALAASLDS